MSKRSFRIERTTDVAAPASEIRRLLLDPSTWHEWQPEIGVAEGPAPMGLGDAARGQAKMLGFEVHGYTEAVEVTDHVFEEDVIVGVRMVIRYEVRPSTSGARVTQRLTAWLPGGVAGRVLSFFLKPRLRALQRGALRNLARQASPPPS